MGLAIRLAPDWVKGLYLATEPAIRLPAVRRWPDLYRHRRYRRQWPSQYQPLYSGA
ncbi:MAG: hypothetical protein RL341_1814 [Pseudomonadota bacterium]